MLKIGEFSRLSQVTVATLHHYDEIGLLKPAQIDRFTNYRYYTLEQLPRLHRIMALMELGLSLEQIDQVINAGLSVEQLRGMLVLKEAEARQRVAGPLNYFIYADEYRPQDIDVEFVVPVEDTHTGDIPLKPAGVMTVREIPGIEEAATYR
ncbi:MAG TPA: helix-turn-helix domain-containing protein [Anaerolineales bacterium]